ncbi:uncharacterized protein LODBEIA_P58480 [Lodderomyces beijingensis]|uniref:Obg-like ATPase 1 n=1 Tax=Lodderomyces beijingensis TaxID=1775926 RepID=A0ABP0ZU02_9ASCO
MTIPQLTRTLRAFSTQLRRSFTTTTHALAAKQPVSSTHGTATTRTILGRPSNNLSTGLVGLANVGKSTFFQALTRSKLGNPANYPYATIEPEKSLVLVPSDKLLHYQKIYTSAKTIPTNLTIWDIAGLTRNSSSGAGLGNKFLGDIRQVDGILQIVRGFVDDDIIHIEDNKVDPVRDLVIVTDELILKDLEIIESEVEKTKKHMRKPGQKQVGEEQLKTLDKLSDLLYEGQKVVNGEWSAEEADFINGLNLLTAKPTLYLLNVNEQDYVRQDNAFLAQVQAWITENCPQDKLMLFSAQHERKLNELEGVELEEHQAAYPRESVIPQVVDQMRKVLNLISFFTCGPLEARQWTVRQGSTAPEAAGIIHSDLQKTFINAIVYKWDDLETLQEFDEAKLKSKGKQYRQGKSYVVEEGDVLIVKAAGGKSR